MPSKRSTWLSSAALCACFLCVRPVAAEPNEVEQRERLASLSPVEKEQLIRKQERFEALPQAERDRLRTLQASVDADPRGAELLAVMSRYNEWLKTLSSAERAELLSLPAEARIAKIKEIQKQQEQQRFRQLAGQLPEEDRETIYRWLLEFAEQHEKSILERTPPDFRKRLESMSAEDRQRSIVRSFVWRRFNSDEPRPMPEDITALVPRLSTETQQRLASVKSPDEKLKLAGSWMMATIASKAFPQISDAERQKLFAKLDVRERERLEQLSPEQQRRELNRMHYFDQVRSREGGRSPGGRFDEGRGPGGPGGGPGGLNGPGRGFDRRPFERGGDGDHPDDRGKGPRGNNRGGRRDVPRHDERPPPLDVPPPVGNPE